MNNDGATPTEPSELEEWETDWRIRNAEPGDVPAIAAAARELLVELGAREPPSRDAIEDAARKLVEEPEAGVVLVAEQDGAIVGVLGVSWQLAMRVPGEYGLIQELWVHPKFRARTIGGDLLAALFELARRRQVFRLEVGLPSERFPHLAATEAFYMNNGFTAIGLRMRRLL